MPRTARDWLVLMALAIVLLIAIGKQARPAVSAARKPPPAHRATTTAAAAPASIATSRYAWAVAMLRAIPAPVTRANVCAVESWEAGEGGGFGNQARANPLNLNPSPSWAQANGWPGHHAIGAWWFPNAATGLAYTIRTIRQPLYGGIRAALRQGGSTSAVLSEIVSSPWAVSRYGGWIRPVC